MTEIDRIPPRIRALVTEREIYTVYGLLVCARAQGIETVLAVMDHADWGDLLEFYRGEEIGGEDEDLPILRALAERRECGLGMVLQMLEALDIPIAPGR